GWRSLHDGAEAGAIDTETGVGSARFLAQSPPQHWIVDRSGTGSPRCEVSANERRHMAGTVAEAPNVHTLVFCGGCLKPGCVGKFVTNACAVGAGGVDRADAAAVNAHRKRQHL
ncbi:MAG TPA: hypothetical protein VN636_11970, partial [Acidimicrobiia bacterium]|nr:hypothetical protein [Acidimicrobiia bacterium]